MGNIIFVNYYAINMDPYKNLKTKTGPIFLHGIWHHLGHEDIVQNYAEKMSIA
jgi:hypothetical protein